MRGKLVVAPRAGGDAGDLNLPILDNSNDASLRRREMSLRSARTMTSSNSGYWRLNLLVFLSVREYSETGS